MREKVFDGAVIAEVNHSPGRCQFSRNERGVASDRMRALAVGAWAPAVVLVKANATLRASLIKLGRGKRD